MARGNTPSVPRSKAPAKPYPDFPLFAHATGRWAKKIRGRLHYFGPWRDPQAALERHLAVRDDLYAGRQPRQTGEGLTVRDLCNRFLTVKQNRVESGELPMHSRRYGNDTHTSSELGNFGR